tara:strand:- start:1779 stop:2417 length:639 start_codon:yes stop_codon:yes gene_type:complete
MRTDTQAIEQYINSGGAVADAQKALATGNKIAGIGVSAGTSIAGGLATGTGLFATGGTLATALTGAGVASSTVPVVGWVVAGVLLASAGAVTIGAKRRARFLSKDRGLLEKYIKDFSKRTYLWRFQESKRQISIIQYMLTKRQSKRNMKRKAKAELKLEALYFLVKQEKIPILQQQRIALNAEQASERNRQALMIGLPLAIGTLGLVWYLNR